MNKYSYDWIFMLLKEFREPLLSFELIYLEIPFVVEYNNNVHFEGV